MVYANGHQLNNDSELKLAIQKAWNEIALETLQGFSNNMPNRLFQVINRNGVVHVIIK